VRNKRSNQAITLSRREFLKGSTATAAIFAFPTIVPSSVFGTEAPSERITIGCIGLGSMGTINTRAFLSKSGVQVLALCDVNKGSGRYREPGDFYGREPAREIVNSYYASRSSSGQYKGCDAYNDFRDLLARDDIDAVVVSTPDHWHVLISIAAVRAGKDVYCEKPLTLTIAEGRALVNEVKRYERVLQTGSQQRSSDGFRFACELVRNGRIGKVHTVNVEIPANNKTCGPTWTPESVPEGFDYDFWLGPAPWAPYTTQRCHYQFRFNLDYGGGQVTNWGAHHLDIAQWGLGMDNSGPVEIEGSGEFPTTGLFTTATKVYFEATYANGVKLICKTGDPVLDSKGVDTFDGIDKFEGTDGWVLVTRKSFETQPESLMQEIIGPDEIHLYKSKDHKQNFLDCVKSRQSPVTPAEVGHRSATVCHLGNIAMLLSRKLRWDPDKERFIGDDEANRMLSRPMRSPWHL